MKFGDINKTHSASTSTNQQVVKSELVDVPKQPNVQDAIDDSAPYRFVESQVKRMNFSILQENLENCLNIIDNEVMKGYVTRLDEMPLVILQEEDFSQLNDIHFFKISELVYQEDEFSVDKLAMVFQTLSSKPCTLVMMLQSNGEKTDFYLGARPNGTNSAGTLFQMLKNSLIGFFPGSKISEYYDDDMKNDMRTLNVGCISEVTCVADYKQQQNSTRTNKEFIQGLEKFVYAMHGKSYTAVLIADNLSYEQLISRKREYERIYTQISPFANMQMNFTLSEGTSKSEGSSSGRTSSISKSHSDNTTNAETDTNSFTIGASKSVTVTDTVNYSHTYNQSCSRGNTHTTGSSDSNGETVTNSVNVSISSGMSLGNEGGPLKVGMNSSTSIGNGYSTARSETHTDSVSDSISKTLTHGFSDTIGISHSDGNTFSNNENRSQGKSIGISTGETDTLTNNEAFTYTDTLTLTESLGNSKSMTLNSQNMTLALALDKIRKHLNRIEECESIGMWNFAAYFLGSITAEAETAANTYKSVVAGVDSGIECSAVNSWNDDHTLCGLMRYIRNFFHPQFLCERLSCGKVQNIVVNPAVMVSTNELAIHMGLPRHSVVGLPVAEHASFGKEVISIRKTDDKKIRIGTIYDMGLISQTEIELDLNSLTMHTLVTGSTGSGKSNVVCHLLSEARKKSIPFLVVEPAKGEYKTVFSDVKFYGTNPIEGELLRIDPFFFSKNIHVLEHIDRIIEIFNVCWPMYAAMPAVLKNAVEKAYEDCGWNLTESTNEYGENLFPNFTDIARNVKLIIDSSEYDTENKGAYKGSLLTRLNSLTNGINGLIFNSDEISACNLFDRHVIIDLSRVGSGETKSLIMGMLVLKLQEYRMTSGRMNSELKHITVLEEAHNLLKRTSTEQPVDGGNLLGKSVEMLANSIAEMRTYGEGFIIADQAPGLLDISVIRNTNTKIILRLPDQSDRELVGKAANLNENQIAELAKLPCGVAAVYQNEWIHPVLCKVDEFRYFKESYKRPKWKTTEKASIDPKKSLKIAEMLSSGTAMSHEQILNEINPILQELKVSSSVHVSICKLLLNPLKEPRMTKLAPIMSELFSNVRKAIEAAYSKSRVPMDWTNEAETALLDSVNEPLQDWVRRDIIQAIVTDYVYIKLGNSDDLERWTMEGVR